jgi:predicted  nucleic acid-binding Zn-ribbon protein
MAASDDANELKGILAQIQGYLKQSSDEASTLSSAFNKASNSLSSLVDIASKLVDTQNNINEASSKEIENLLKQLKLNKEKLNTQSQSLREQIAAANQDKQRLASAIQINQEEKNRLEQKKASNRLTASETKTLREITSELANQERTFDSLNQQLRESGQLYAQTRAAIRDSNGDIQNLEDSLQKALNVAEFKEDFEIVKKTLSSISTPLDGILKPINLINNVIGFVVGGAKEIDKEMGDTAKSMNMTYEAVGKSKMEMIKFAEASGIPLANSVNLNKQVTELNKSLGSSVAFENMGKALQEDVALMGELAAKAGYTAEETNSMLKYTMATGQSAKDVMKTGLATAKVEGMKRGVLLNEKEIMKDIAKSSEAIKLSVSGGGAGLVKAAAAAKALGTDLATVDKIAGSLLNFEQSIESELQAELLTGKQLNLETARQAALNGDLATVADEVAKNIGSAAEFSKMNRIQQDAIAQSVGMSRDELGKTLIEQEALKNVGEASMEDARTKYDALVKQKGEAYALKSLGDEALAQQFQQQSLDEKRAEAAKVMQDKLATEIMPTMVHMADIFDRVFNKIKNIVDALGGMKSVLVIIGAIIGAKMAMGMVAFGKSVMEGVGLVKKLAIANKIAAIGSIIKGAWTSLGPIPFVGAALAATAAVAGVAYLASTMTGDDVMSPGGSGGGYGKRTLFGPEGAIQLNNKDTVIAGTNLFGPTSKGDDVMSAPPGGIKVTGGGGGGGDMSAIVNAISQLRTDINALASRPINVNVDGKKIIDATTGANPNEDGDAMRKNSYKVQ